MLRTAVRKKSFIVGTYISEIRQYLQNLPKLSLVDSIKFFADKGLNVRSGILIHLRDRSKSKGVDQNPQRNILMLTFVMLNIKMFRWLVQQRFQIACNEFVDLIRIVSRMKVVVVGIKVGGLLLTVLLTERIA